MTELEDFIVQEPYKPTEEEKEAISELQAKGLVPSNWNSGKKGIESFKNNIRNHMYYKQNFRCAYCRIELSKACDFLQREHIIPKTSHPKWMFEPRNLCITCDRCNNYKNDEEVLQNPDVVNYPAESDDYLIINPFLDKYSDHIELKEGIIYVGKTDKGRFTIKTCHLSRTELAEERAKQRMKEENPDTVLSQLLSLLSSTNTAAEDVDKVKQDLEKIVKMYKMAQNK